jgi:hypothetical protein
MEDSGWVLVQLLLVFKYPMQEMKQHSTNLLGLQEVRVIIQFKRLDNKNCIWQHRNSPFPMVKKNSYYYKHSEYHDRLHSITV